MGGGKSPVEAYVAVCRCHEGTDHFWELFDTAFVFSHNAPLLSRGLPASVTSSTNCSGCQTAVALHGTQSLQIGSRGGVVLKMSTMQVMMIQPPAQLHILSAGSFWGGEFPKAGSIGVMHLSHEVHSYSTVQVTVQSSSGEDADCPVLWVQGYQVALRLLQLVTESLCLYLWTGSRHTHEHI